MWSVTPRCYSEQSMRNGSHSRWLNRHLWITVTDTEAWIAHLSNHLILMKRAHSRSYRNSQWRQADFCQLGASFLACRHCTVERNEFRSTSVTSTCQICLGDARCCSTIPIFCTTSLAGSMLFKTFRRRGDFTIFGDWCFMIMIVRRCRQHMSGAFRLWSTRLMTTRRAIETEYDLDAELMSSLVDCLAQLGEGVSDERTAK